MLKAHQTGQTYAFAVTFRPLSPWLEPMRDDRPEAESTFQLLERARSGDQEAVNQLFARHARPLQRWASGRLPKWARDVNDTEDLVQETLLQTFKRIGQFEPRGAGALQAYLRQAILNRIREELRRKGRRPDGTGLTDLEAGNYLSPLEQAIGTEAIERYDQALARLSPDEREALIGRIELGYTYEELAESLGKPTADAARKAAQRALIRLVQEMERGAG
jgi:RNA polymerase sigma-70 factor, ECF subfamily